MTRKVGEKEMFVEIGIAIGIATALAGLQSECPKLY
jgi:hypothetical protein